ncbi:MAG: SRPBCC domain-containing protein [Methylocella sp.]
MTKIDAKASAPASAVKREVVITRVFDAPRGLVFKAWTDPEHMVRWWGPKGFTNPICELDARVGGAWRTVMRSPPEQWIAGLAAKYRDLPAPQISASLARVLKGESRGYRAKLSQLFPEPCPWQR